MRDAVKVNVRFAEERRRCIVRCDKAGGKPRLRVAAADAGERLRRENMRHDDGVKAVFDDIAVQPAGIGSIGAVADGIAACAALAFGKLVADGKQARRMQRALRMHIAHKAGCPLGFKGKCIPDLAGDAAVKKLLRDRPARGIVAFPAVAGKDQGLHTASASFPLHAPAGAVSHGCTAFPRACARRFAARRRGRL